MSSTTTIFDGRHDGYFDSPKLKYVETPALDEWWEQWDDHWLGNTDIGVYPRLDNGTCRWGCVDIDSGDFSEALEVQAGLRAAGIASWIEASKSKGYHVWVFCDGWVHAGYMRPLLVEVAHAAGLPEKTEINPKQVEATKKGVGNCVRLPYGAWSRAHPGRCCMVLSPNGEYRPFSLEDFLAEVEPTPVLHIELVGGAAAARQQARVSVKNAVQRLRELDRQVPLFGPRTPKGGSDQRACKILMGLDRANDGERNECAFVMACYLKGIGKSEDQARSEMTTAVRRSFDRGEDFVDEAMEVVAKVYRS